MSKLWTIWNTDGQRVQTVSCDGISMDNHGNVVFVDVLTPAPNQTTEIVGILCAQSGVFARQEEN